MERIDELTTGKRRIFGYYEAALRDLPVVMNPEPFGTTNGFWMPTIVADEAVGFDRGALIAVFRENGIDGRAFFWPLSMLPMFEPAPRNVVALSLYSRAFNLPSYHDLSCAEMDRVISLVRSAIS